MVVWRILYGSYFSGPAPYLRNYEDFHLLRPVHAIECLFSTNHGLFLWHPLLAVGLAGLAWAGRKQWQTAAGLALAFLATWYLVSCWQVWFAGASFGNRLFLSVLLVFGAGWGVIGARLQSRKAKSVLWIVILTGGLWNAGLAVQYGTGIVPRQGEVPLSTLVGNQFTKAPKMIVSRLAQAITRNPELTPSQTNTDVK